MFRANMAYYIDTFFESANYDEVINSILDDVFKYLKNDLQIDKAEYVDMAIRTEAYIRANKRLPAIVYRMSTLPDYKDSTMKLFINTFNFKGNTIDEALAVIAKKKLYSKYFNSQKTDKKTINDASQGKGSNCVDWGASILQNSQIFRL